MLIHYFCGKNPCTYSIPTSVLYRVIAGETATTSRLDVMNSHYDPTMASVFVDDAVISLTKAFNFVFVFTSTPTALSP
jgi:hypothetical protein